MRPLSAVCVEPYHRFMPPKPSTAASAGPPIQVLVVDNDLAHAEAMADSLRSVGFACTVAGGGREAISLLESSTFEIVDHRSEDAGVGGLEVLAKCKELQPDAEVILVTGHGTIESAVEAMQHGAFNYLLKPLDLKQLRAVVENAARSQYLRRANAELHRRLDERFGFEGVIGNSPQMHDVMTRLQRIAPTDATVLIQGETGTGKELVAKAIHQNSPRKKRPFVPLNCAALSEHILESELFGHIRGAFTDASSRSPGQVRVRRRRHAVSRRSRRHADPDADQAAARAGERRDHARRLERAGEGERADPLGHEPRLGKGDRRRHVSRGPVPPAEGGDDQAAAAGRAARGHSAADRLLSSRSTPSGIRRRFAAFRRPRGGGCWRYDWPGNVRQLRNVIESMVVVDIDEVLDVDDLPAELAPADGEAASAAGTRRLARAGRQAAGGDRSAVHRRNAQSHRRQPRGSGEMLGIGERTLYRKIKEYGLS